MTIVSDGVSRFTLRVPFSLPAGWSIGGWEEAATEALAGHPASFALNGGRYVLTVDGFRDLPAAADFEAAVHRGLMLTILELGLPVLVERGIREPQFADDPEAAAHNLERTLGLRATGPVHGLIDGGFSSAYPTGLTIRAVSVNAPDVRLETAASSAISTLALGIDGYEEPIDPQLQVALDLYRAHLVANTASARLLNLVLALESMMVPPSRPAVVQELFNEFEESLGTAEGPHPPDSPEAAAIRSVRDALPHWRKASIRSQCRALVVDAARRAGRDDPDGDGRRAVWIYDRRSELVHTGALDRRELADATRQAAELVKLVLMDRLTGPD